MEVDKCRLLDMYIHNNMTSHVDPPENHDCSPCILYNFFSIEYVETFSLGAKQNINISRAADIKVRLTYM